MLREWVHRGEPALRPFRRARYPTSTQRPEWVAPSCRPHRRRISHDGAQAPGVFGEKLFRLILGHPAASHHYRRLHASISGRDDLLCGTAIEPGCLHDDPPTSVDEFVIPGPQVHHQVAIDLAEPDHGTGR